MCSVSSPSLSCLQEQGPGGAGLVREAVSLPSSLVTCKPHPVLCMSQCSRLGLGLAGTHLSHTPQSGSDPSSQHTARVGPSETLRGASFPGPAGLIRDGRTGRRDGAGQDCSSHGLKHATADTGESPVTAQPRQPRAVPRPRKGTGRSSPSGLFQRGDHGLGQASQSETWVTVKACILHTHLFIA